MNADTVTLFERPYQEVVDDILTAMVGGVVNEPILFDVKEDLFPLSRAASDVRGITGTVSVRDATGERKPTRHSFLKSVDFEYSESDHAIIWLSGGTKPDDETVFYVDYFVGRESRSPLSDINVGSVTRTLSEAIGREIATVYQQINQAYLAGFVETANGQALDLVVAILGVKRQTKEFAVGLVTFFRDAAAGDGNITVPEGTLVSTAKGEVIFVSVELRTLQRGQARIDVPVRATVPGDDGIVAAGAITTLPQPITGINRITNFEGTLRAADDESDDELRARAKAVLRGLGKATLAALTNAIVEQRAKLVEAFDPNSPPDKETEPERFPDVRNAVEETRAAGVQATVVARYIFFTPHIIATIAPGLPDAGKDKVKSEIIAEMQKYVDTLNAGESAKGEELLKAIKNVKEVNKDKDKTKIVDVIVEKSDLGKTGPDETVRLLLNVINGVLIGPNPPDNDETRATALSGPLAKVLSEAPSALPSGQRVADRGLRRAEAERERERLSVPRRHARGLHDIAADRFGVGRCEAVARRSHEAARRLARPHQPRGRVSCKASTVIQDVSTVSI